MLFKGIFCWICIICVLQIGNINCDCGVCQSSNNIACHSETTFSLCIKGTPIDDHIPCPKDTVCTTDLNICINDAQVTPSCNPNGTKKPRDPDTLCNEEQSDGDYTNEIDETCTSFVTCFKDPNGVYQAKINKCSKGQWWNGDFCFNEMPDGCTIPKEPRDADTLCKEQQVEDDFASEVDSTCTSYVKCQKNQVTGEFSGIETCCGSDKYFNAEMGRCTNTKPNGCKLSEEEPSIFCQGNYKNDADPSCNSYLYCVKRPRDKNIKCTIYYCDDDKWFSDNNCQTAKPAECV